MDYARVGPRIRRDRIPRTPQKYGGAGGGIPEVSVIFNLPLDDAGAGIVNTVPTTSAGSPTPTFTRATVAWTKLSTGLWAQVASGQARSCYLGATTAVGVYGGYFAEGAGTQLVTPDASIRDMTNAAWTKGATMTAAKTATGIDGAANSCTTLTGGAVSATNTAFQTLVAAASSRTYSCWIKRRTGTGTINITQDGGSTYTDITSQINGSTFTRVSLTASVLNAAFGIQVVTNTDAIDVDFNQFEAGAFATSPMATAGAARNLDDLRYSSTGNANLVTGTAYCEFAALQNINGGSFLSFANLTYPIGEASAGRIIMFDGTNNTLSGNSKSTSAVNKGASAWSGIVSGICLNGGTPVAGTFDGAMAGATIDPGGAQVMVCYGQIKNVRIYNSALSNADLQALTT